MNSLTVLLTGSEALEKHTVEVCCFPEAARHTDYSLLNHKRSRFYFLSPYFVVCVHSLLIGFFYAST